MGKKIIALTLILFIFCVGLCSCFPYRRGSLGRNGCYEAYAILCANVPFVYNSGFHDASYLCFAEEMERDSYGRILYWYIGSSLIPDEKGQYWADGMITFLICQQSEHDRAYYYEDVCYLAYATDARNYTELKEECDSFTEEALEQWKQANDWGQPPTDKKLVSAPYDEKSLIKYEWEWWPESFEEAFRKEVQIGKGDVDGKIIGSTSAGKIMCAIASDYKQVNCYLLLYDESAENPIVQLQEIPFSLNLQKEVQAFRESISKTDESVVLLREKCG